MNGIVLLKLLYDEFTVEKNGGKVRFVHLCIPEVL